MSTPSADQTPKAPRRAAPSFQAVIAAALALWAGSTQAADRTPRAPTTPEPHATAAPRVQLRGEWFYVDGEPFLIKGIGYSPYRPGQVPWKDTVDLAVMDKDFKRITAAGFNTLRTWKPLPPEALSLAERYGLMVLQGIWIEPGGNYASEASRQAVLEIVRKEVERSKGHQNILAFLVGNELEAGSVYRAGIPELESLLQQVVRTVKAADPTRFVSYANWPSLSFLDASSWDAVCFNVYPYEPASVAYTFGFRSYVEHLRKTVGRGKPFIVTEVGLSVSPKAGTKRGYGGLTPEQQKTDLVRLWDELFQAGAQGGVVFEWNDEWWKHDGATDATEHDAQDPEEWFGLTEFTAADRTGGQPRPAYAALKAYNQAVLLSPVSQESYQDRVPVTVYTEEPIATVRLRLNKGPWQAATRLNRHLWKAFLTLDPKDTGEVPLVMEAYDVRRRLLVRRDRPTLLGPRAGQVVVSVNTDRAIYEAAEAMEPVRYSLTITDPAGRPLPKRTVYWSVSEPQAAADLTQEKTTDERGMVEGTYLVQDPGLILLSAATAPDPRFPARRVGAETVVIIRQLPSLRHVPSPWETNLPPEVVEGLRHVAPAFQLSDPGTERIVDYERYGAFHDAGTSHYRYEATNWEGLSAAVGEGIYPNERGLLKDAAYQVAKRAGKLEGSHWDFVFGAEPQLAFFKWAEAQEEVGVKQFYTALALERAGLLLQAVKAYDAVLVHFPTSIGWTAFDPPTPWYVGKVAREKIEAILRLHPELGMRLDGARVEVQNGFDNDVDNDVFVVDPGRLVAVAPDAVNPPSLDLSTLARRRVLGKGTVQLVEYANGHWQLLVAGKPWTIHGISYKPTAVGETPDEGPLPDWTSADRNHDRTIDALQTFVDANRNNRPDTDEPVVGDFELLHRMGVNTLRLYHTDHKPATTKPLLRTLYKRYGFRVMMGDFVGMYTVGSGATWEQGTNYLDKVQRKRMFDNVKHMVLTYKDEPYLLLWVLGNENNYGGVHGIVGGVGNAGKYPKAYYSFINELARWIHSVDPNHPVAIGNGDILFLDVIAKAAPDIDIFGANAYRGWQGFGRSMYESVHQLLDKPVLITEFGCPAYQLGRTRDIAERDQALYHFGNWVDLADNMAGRGVGNVIGGAVFEWSDEWWKAGQPPRFSARVQETQPNWAGPFPGGWNFEEWFGLVGQGDGSLSPFLRQLRLSYQLYQALWNPSPPAPEAVAPASPAPANGQ